MSTVVPPPPSPATDAELLRAAATSEDHGTAIAELHRRYADDVRAVCTNQLRRDPASIDDLVQETFLRLLIHAHTIHDPDRLIRWLRRTARHACHDHRRRAHHHREHPTTDHPLTHVEDFTDLLADRDRVQRLLTHMDQRHAHVLTAHYLHGLSITDIATRMRLTPGAVRTLLYRARQEGRRLIQTGKALLPLPVLEWAERLTHVVRTGPALPGVLAALAPVIAATVLVPTLLAPTEGGGAGSPIGPATVRSALVADPVQPPVGAAGPAATAAHGPALPGSTIDARPEGGASAADPAPPAGAAAPPEIDLGVVRAGPGVEEEGPGHREIYTEMPGGLGGGPTVAGDIPAGEQVFGAACTADEAVDAMSCS